MPNAKLSVFRTAEGAAAYHECYERTLALWHPAAEPLQIETRFGSTRVNAAGSPDSPPLLLIHGFGFSSTQWYPNVPALATHFRIYAPDVPDQFGMSTLTQPIQTRENYALWLSEVLDGLGIARAGLVGHSYGGWLGANFVLHQPERVARLVLIAPAATFVPLSRQFYLRGIFGGALANFLKMDFPVYSMVRWMTTLRLVRGLEIVEQFKIGMKNFAPVPVGVPVVFGREEFAQMTMPVLLLIGEREVIYPRRAEQVIAEAQRLLLSLQTALILNGGHAVTLDQSEATNRTLLSFLMQPQSLPVMKAA